MTEINLEKIDRMDKFGDRLLERLQEEENEKKDDWRLQTNMYLINRLEHNFERLQNNAYSENDLLDIANFSFFLWDKLQLSKEG